MSLKQSKYDHLAFTIQNQLEMCEERNSINLSCLFDSLFATYLDESIAKDLVIEIEPNYAGLRLGDEFEETYLKEMLNDFYSNRVLHAKYALKIIDHALDIIKKMSNIREVNLCLNEECIIIGNLHGHFEDLIKIIQRFNLPGKHYYFIFNGNWVNRGDKQIECLLTIFYSFILYPKRVYLNRGNHEDKIQTSQPSYKTCLKIATLKYFGKYGRIVFNRLDELFRHLQLATIVNNLTFDQRYFVVHGGINDQIDLKQIQKLDRSLFTSLCSSQIVNNLPKRSRELYLFDDVVDMIWSDPIDQTTHPNSMEFNSIRNIGKFFGEDVTRNFLNTNKFTKLIRSHECKQDGYDIVHSGLVITVFSASNYNSTNNSGAVIKLSSIKPRLDILTYKSDELKKELDLGMIKEDNLTKAIKKLRAYLYRFKERILNDCSKYDLYNLDVIKINELIDVLNGYLPNIPYFYIKDRLCECDDLSNLAKYRTLFDTMNSSFKYDDDDQTTMPKNEIMTGRPSNRGVVVPDSIRNNFNLLETIFHLIDSDNNGFISPNEFKFACDAVFNYLGVNFTQEEIELFIEFMDSNKDGHISLEEFSNAFSIACNT